MANADFLEDFDHAEYEPEARERWGDESVERSNAAWKALGPAGQTAHMTEHRAIAEGVAAMAATDLPEPADPELQELVARHYAWVSLFWVPDREAYTGLGAMYADDHRFRATYDKFGDGTADLLRDGIAVWAAEHLK